jgi:hypothetical protein
MARVEGLPHTATEERGSEVRGQGGGQSNATESKTTYIPKPQSQF